VKGKENEIRERRINAMRKDKEAKRKGREMH
jgi:hypothetical protein